MAKVSIADDNEDILDSAALLLEIRGHEVETVQRSSDIVGRVRAERPDVHLQDVNMPGLDLGRVIAELRADETTSHIPVVLFTASGPLAKEWQEIGADGCLRKPFEADDLDLLVRKAAQGGREAVREQAI